MLSLGEGTRDFFSIFFAALQPNSFSGCFWGLCFQIPLSSQATALIKKSRQSSESQLRISGWWVYQDGFVWLNSPTWENCQLCCTHFTIPLVSLGAKTLGQANDVYATVINNHHHLILYLTQDTPSNFTDCIHIKNTCFLITDPNFHSR